MNTQFALLAIHEKTDIPLKDICEQYLGINDAAAKRKALRQKLPFPVWRAPGQKSPWLVNVADLAKYIDQEIAKATKDHTALHAA
ncbi:pyocin activator PrtN family protein [uncultured Gilvimarinus sp.]|uniref:pyocin activator PrtN family protein n=1 Tax=uncultured Gilvimarinus sp. TaxID=1689143 RepID=UPI0030D913FA